MLPAVTREREGRVHDRPVAGAAAEVSGECLAHLGLRRRWVLPQERRQREQDARGARAALRAAGVEHRLLERGQLAVGAGEALDRRHLPPLGMGRGREARNGGTPVEQHRARPAPPFVAADLRSGQAEPVSQDVDERAERRRAATSTATPLTINLTRSLPRRRSPHRAATPGGRRAGTSPVRRARRAPAAPRRRHGRQRAPRPRPLRLPRRAPRPQL